MNVHLQTEMIFHRWEIVLCNDKRGLSLGGTECAQEVLCPFTALQD